MPLANSYSLFHKINTILPRNPKSVDQFSSQFNFYCQLQTYRIRSIASPRYVVCDFDSTTYFGSLDYLKLDGRTFDCHKFGYRTFDCRHTTVGIRLSHIQKTVPSIDGTLD